MSKPMQNLSPRELTLAITVVVLLCVFLLGAGVKRGVNTVRELDGQIDRLEQELVMLHQHIAQAEEVDAAFRKVSARHSTPLSKAEIHDYLRREIYRLATRRNLGDDSGAPSSESFLVHIPVLREGVLNEFDDGYREYKINFRVPSASIDDMLLFVERLQQSEQLLRVDSFDLARSPQSEVVSAAFEVTRTVIDRPRGDFDGLLASDTLDRNGSVEDWPADGPGPAHWTVEQCDVVRNESQVTHGAAALEVVPTGAAPRVFQYHTLESSQTYAVTMEITAASSARLYALDTAGQPLGPRADIPGDAKPYRYELTFTTPAQPGGRCRVQVPSIHIEQDGGPLVLDNVRIRVAAAEEE